MLSIFSYVYGPSVCPPWRRVYSGPLSIYFKNMFIYLFLEREKGKEKKRERNMGVLEIVASRLQHRHVLWLGIQPESFWSQAGIQSTEPHQAGFAHFLIGT